MPGQIKIDDGAGNYTVLTNGGSLGSDKTITIPNTTGTMALTSNLPNAQLDEIDMWVVNTDLTSDHQPIIDTYWTRHSGTLINMPIGTGMSVNSSGHWTFPKTGYYEITFLASVENDTNSNATEIKIDGTNDNFSSNDAIAFARYYGGDNSRTSYLAYAIVDITDVSNDKVQFDFNEVNTSTLRGGITDMRTGVVFKRLCDT